MNEQDISASFYVDNRSELFDRALRDYGSARRIVRLEGPFTARWLDANGERQELLGDRPDALGHAPGGT